VRWRDLEEKRRGKTLAFIREKKKVHKEAIFNRYNGGIRATYHRTGRGKKQSSKGAFSYPRRESGRSERRQQPQLLGSTGFSRRIRKKCILPVGEGGDSVFGGQPDRTFPKREEKEVADWQMRGKEVQQCCSSWIGSRASFGGREGEVSDVFF